MKRPSIGQRAIQRAEEGLSHFYEAGEAAVEVAQSAPAVNLGEIDELVKKYKLN